ncbi:MAG: hypothetical protein M0P69_03195 [Bacteroidales bacterium]|jgi:hypothetical protein|nr:hypothetical protein [Bacteroidales bacterium]
MQIFIQKITSRKFLMALLAAVTAYIKAYWYPDFPDAALYAVVVAAVGYNFGEGFVDGLATLAAWLEEKKEEKGE